MGKADRLVLRRNRDPLGWVRRVCQALPGTTEIVAWGHPNFRAAGRTFAVFEIYKARPCIAIAADPEEQSTLVGHFGFFKTPYLGSRGWVSAWVDQPAPWSLMRNLITRAHRRCLNKPRRIRTARGARKGLPGRGSRS